MTSEESVPVDESDGRGLGASRRGGGARRSGEEDERGGAAVGEESGSCFGDSETDAVGCFGDSEMRAEARVRAWVGVDGCRRLRLGRWTRWGRKNSLGCGCVGLTWHLGDGGELDEPVVCGAERRERRSRPRWG